MRGPFHPVFGSGGRRRPADAATRPIASSLKLPQPHVAKIAQSHERCAALGVSRIDRPDLSPLAWPDLSIARERNRRLHEHAAPVMEMLYEQIVDSEHMVVLTDATGTIIHSIGDDDFLARASKVALQPGVNWSESTKGTNAIGTALVEESPTLVHADEHYLHAHHFLTCSAAPILDPRGNILGVLDVSGDHRSYHQHTMALVKMSARMIENHWLTDEDRNVMRLHFHSRVEFIGTLMEGILAVRADGSIVGANRGALEQLGLSGAALRMHSLGTLFGTTVAALVDRFRSPLATPVPVQGPGDGGRLFHIHARFNWPVWTSLAEAVSTSVAHPGTARDPRPPTVDAASRPVPSSADAAGTAPQGADTPGAALEQLCTGDAQMASVIGKIRRVIDRDIPILVLGETGTGKELLARAIHRDSARAQQPFVAVHCSSMPEGLIEAELFGCDEAGVSGARRKGQTGQMGQVGHVGKIVQASGGTLFLDEVGGLPLGLQARLLRVLQERQVRPLGGSRAVGVDLSIVCASQRSLREGIEAGLFREDLFHHLNGLAVRLPPLRKRSDLMALVQRILGRQAADAAPTHSPRRPALAPEVRQLFQRYGWPGNVRQLFNVLRTAAVMAAGEPLITCAHLSDDLLDEARATAEPPAPAARLAALTVAQSTALPTAAATAMPTRSLEAQEIDAIRRALELAGGNISEASKRLGISRNTIYRKLRWNQP